MRAINARTTRPSIFKLGAKKLMSYPVLCFYTITVHRVLPGQQIELCDFANLQRLGFCLPRLWVVRPVVPVRRIDSALPSKQPFAILSSTA
jgi:hypothetical protein